MKPIDLEAIRARTGRGEILLKHEAEALLAHVEALQSTQLDFSLPPQGYCVTDNGSGPFWYTADEYGDDKSDFPAAVRAAWKHEGTHWEAYQEWENRRGT